MKKAYKAVLFAFLLLAGCFSKPPKENLPPPNITIIPATATPTITPTATATRTMKEALQTYTIEGLRTHEYKSGNITFRETESDSRRTIIVGSSLPSFPAIDCEAHGIRAADYWLHRQ